MEGRVTQHPEIGAREKKSEGEAGSKLQPLANAQEHGADREVADGGQQPPPGSPQSGSLSMTSKANRQQG